MTDTIDVRGSYRYASGADLERAMASARERIDDDEFATVEPDWLRAFVRRGTTLRVAVTVPVSADRFLASAVLEALAGEAVEGVVEMRSSGRCVDWFPCKKVFG